MGEINSSDKKNSNSYSEKDQWNDDLDLPPINHQKTETKKPILEKAAFDKKKKLPWKAMLFFILILTSSALIILFQTNKEKLKPIEIAAQKEGQKELIEPITNEDKERDSVILESAANLSEDTMVVEELNAPEVLDALIEVNTRPNNFHIVIGSFESENNAESWLEKISSKEDGTHSIREFNGWHRVIFLSYASIEQAEIEIDSIRNTLKYKAWIAYMK